MLGGSPSKKFPKEYANSTSLEIDGYPVYKRRRDGRIFTAGSETYNNTHVVPYNAYLLLKYQAHINLEVCSLIHAVKYLYKYIYKGNDRAEIELRQEHRDATGGVDEVQQHIDGRYVCAPEAFHRIYSFPLHGRTHSVESLQVHLPDAQRVTFRPGNEQRVLNNPDSRKTTLTAFFSLNEHYYQKELNGEGLGPREVDSRNLTYPQIPENFVFDKSGGNKLWKPRTNGGQLKVGRVHSVAVKEGERYALRRLLMTRKGPRSFEDLRTINGTSYPSFHDAADALGLLHSTDHFSAAMNEAVIYQMPRQLRCLFSSLTCFVSADEAARFWPTYKDDLAADYLRQGYTAIEAEALAYYDISDMVSVANIDLSKFIPPPLPNRPALRNNPNMPNFTEIGEELRRQLNTDQDSIVSEIVDGRSRLIFLDGPGGTGKTFVYNCIYNILRGHGKSVVCTAFTGIAANLLPEGRTLCSLFRLNIAQECRASSIKPNSRDGRYLKELDAIILDECSMVPHWILDVIDTVLRDVTGINQPFGGKIVLIGGDFRQILPIPSKTSGLKPNECSLKMSPIFQLFRRFNLTVNMRAAAETAEWKSYLLKVGNGEEEEDEERRIRLPPHILSSGNLIHEVFGDVFNNAQHVSERAILCPKNKNVDIVNEKILDLMDSEERVYYSNDSIDKNGELDHLTYPEEFLHSLSPSGLPAHRLRLKIGSVVMLLRNLNTANGLCNGTRLQVQRLARNIVTCNFINGSRIGQSVLIPRIELHSDQGMSFTLKRQQFPLKLAFAMSLNKAQGQSLKCVWSGPL